MGAAQDALGEHQDMLVALPLFRAAAQQRAEAWFAVGWLTAERDASARACRQALAKLEAATRFW